MSKKTLYVGNLPFTTTEEEIRQLFAQHGDVISVKIIMDQKTDRSRGFCFVEVNDADADKMIDATNGLEFDSGDQKRKLFVNPAREKDGPSSGGYSGGGYSGGGHSGGGRSFGGGGRSFGGGRPGGSGGRPSFGGDRGGRSSGGRSFGSRG